MIIPVRRLTLDAQERQVAMTPDQLTGAARNLAHGLGIPVYIRDGRIYQDGPGVAFLPPSGARSTVAGNPFLEEEKAGEAERMTLLPSPGLAGASNLNPHSPDKAAILTALTTFPG